MGVVTVNIENNWQWGQMSTRSEGCGGCLVTNDSHPSSWSVIQVHPCQQTPAHSEQASRARAVGIADKLWWAADNRHTAEILVSAASRLISTHAGVLCQLTPACSEAGAAVEILIDPNTVTTPWFAREIDFLGLRWWQESLFK